MKKDSRKLQFKVKVVTLDLEPGGGFTMQVLHVAHVESLAQVSEALAEAQAQVPEIIVQPPMTREANAEGTEPAPGLFLPFGGGPNDREPRPPAEPVEPSELPFNPERPATGTDPNAGNTTMPRPDMESVNKRLKATKEGKA